MKKMSEIKIELLKAIELINMITESSESDSVCDSGIEYFVIFSNL